MRVGRPGSLLKHGTTSVESMVRSSRLLASALVAAVIYKASELVFVGAPVIPSTRQLRSSSVALQARGGGEYDISDADIEKFYAELTTGKGGDPPKGSVVSELIVKFFHGEFTPQGFKRYAGQWKGPPLAASARRTSLSAFRDSLLR